MASALSSFDKFVKGTDKDQGLWALDPSASLVDSLKHRNLYSINEDGSFVEVAHPDKPEPTKKRPGDDSIDRPRVKKQKRKSLPATIYSPSALTMYRDISNSQPALGPKCIMSDQPTHTAPQLRISSNGKTVTNARNGYRLSKASHGVYTGNWYYEVTLTSEGNARIGWSQISADLQAPCGYDCFGYGWRAEPGTLFHAADPVENHAFTRGFAKGDVVGLGIRLPESLTEKEIEELAGRVWDGDEAYVPFKREVVCPFEGESGIRYWMNGREVGEGFEGLVMGKYHPAISLYGKKGAVCTASVNFGPNFAWQVPEGKKSGLRFMGIGYRGMYECAGEKDFIDMKSDAMDIDDDIINSPALDVEGSSPPPDVRMYEEDDVALSAQPVA